MKQKLLSEVHVTMTVRAYGIPMTNRTGKCYTMPGYIERIVEVNGLPVYTIRTATELDEDSTPRRFELWLIELTRSMEIPQYRHYGRTYRSNLFRRCKLIRRKVFRKFIQFKPQFFDVGFK